MQQPLVLRQPGWQPLVLAGLAQTSLLLDLLDRQFTARSVAALGLALLGIATFASRNTVLDQYGVKLPGSIERRVGWADIVEVRQSRMALHHQDIELIVRNKRKPVWVKERNGGRDYRSVQEAWRLHRPDGVGDDK